MIKVQLYYKKQDFDLRKLSINDEDLEFIGENEFSRANAVVAKFQVYSIKEYDEIQITDQTSYFTCTT